MTTEVNALADAFRLVNLGIVVGCFMGTGLGWIAHDWGHWLREYLERRQLRIDPRDVL